jgi:hypothetical protein
LDNTQRNVLGTQAKRKETGKERERNIEREREREREEKAIKV